MALSPSLSDVLVKLAEHNMFFFSRKATRCDSLCTLYTGTVQKLFEDHWPFKMVSIKFSCCRSPEKIESKIIWFYFKISHSKKLNKTNQLLTYGFLVLFHSTFSWLDGLIRWRLFTQIFSIFSGLKSYWIFLISGGPSSSTNLPF